MVTRSTIHKPSRVDRARERLAEAVGRLERALPPPGQSLTDAAAASKQISELTSDLQIMEAENRRLRDRNKQVSERLGTAIQRFKHVIGE